jgi:hypothetical protein
VLRVRWDEGDGIKLGSTCLQAQGHVNPLLSTYEY